MPFGGNTLLAFFKPGKDRRTAREGALTYSPKNEHEGIFLQISHLHLSLAPYLDCLLKFVIGKVVNIT
jgi:hypothetical protein